MPSAGHLGLVLAELCPPRAPADGLGSGGGATVVDWAENETAKAITDILPIPTGLKAMAQDMMGWACDCLCLEGYMSLPWSCSVCEMRFQGWVCGLYPLQAMQIRRDANAMHRGLYVHLLRSAQPDHPYISVAQRRNAHVSWKVIP